jgi:hypothetical protein
MADQFNVTAAYDKPSYVGGDTIKVTISGDDVVTSVATVQIGPLAIQVINPSDGVTQIINAPAEQATITTVAHNSVIIDTSVPIIDSSTAPRVWTPSTDKLSITSVA